MVDLPSFLGAMGTLLILAAYVPQIRHLAESKCTAGLSMISWHLWLVGSLLLFIHAYAQRDAVFMAVQGINAAAVALTLYLAKKYEGKTCLPCQASPLRPNPKTYKPIKPSFKG